MGLRDFLDIGYWGHYEVSQPLFDTDEDAPAFFRLYSLTLNINLYPISPR